MAQNHLAWFLTSARARKQGASSLRSCAVQLYETGLKPFQSPSEGEGSISQWPEWASKRRGKPPPRLYW